MVSSFLSSQAPWTRQSVSGPKNLARWNGHSPDPSLSSGMTAPECTATKLSRGGDLLMANVFGSGGVNRIFRDVGGMVADAFEMARDKHQVDIAA
jgi:hypothetical protein